MRTLRTYALVFVLFAASFTLVLGLTIGIVLGSAADGVVAGLVGGVSCAALVTVILGALDRVGDRGRRPGESHGPRQDVAVPVRADADLPERIQSALLELKAEIREADPSTGRYTARTRRSWRSWGEDVTVELTGDQTAPVARITSRPVIRTTLIDYGKGRRNVKQVAAALQA